MTSNPKLAQYLNPWLPEERVAAQFAGSLAVADRRRKERRARLVLALGAACLLVAVALRPWRAGDVEQAALAGLVFESGRSEPQRVTLPDETRVELAPATQITAVELSRRAVRLRIERGAVTLEVPPQPDRTLTVQAGGYDVTVVGTRFRVALGSAPGEPKLGVSVERGRVRVQPTGGGPVTLLSAGERWLDERIPVSASGAPAAAPSEASAPPSETSAAPYEASAEAAVPSGAPAPPDWRKLRVTSPKDAYAALGPAGFARAVATGSPVELFELYELAQLNKRPSDAATALDALRRRHRGDARAGLAAFELGRLRMDSLGDRAGAAEALEDALRLGRGAPFREDAEARLVQAYDALGNTARCARARRLYLEHYPKGAHASTVKRSCSAE